MQLTVHITIFLVWFLSSEKPRQSIRPDRRPHTARLLQNGRRRLMPFPLCHSCGHAILLCFTRRHLPWQTIGDSDVLTVLHCFLGGEFFLILILLPKPVLDLTSSQYRVLFYHLYTALHERHNLGVGHVWVSNGQQYSNTASLRCA